MNSYKIVFRKQKGGGFLYVLIGSFFKKKSKQILYCLQIFFNLLNKFCLNFIDFKKLFICFFLLLMLFGCSENDDSTQIKHSNVKKIKITTSILPLASIVQYIGGDYVELKSIVPLGVSPHNFDLKTSHMIDIQESDLIIYLRLEHIDGFLEKAIGNKDSLIVSEGIDFISIQDKEYHKNEVMYDSHNKEYHKNEVMYDPHIWSGPENAKIIAFKIKEKLSILYPEKSKVFQKNYNIFLSRVNDLVTNFKRKIVGKKQNKSIIFHNAYNYLFADLGIKKEKILVFRSNILSDPHSLKMKQLFDEIKTHSIQYVFREPQFDNGNFDKFAYQNNLKVYILDPLGGNSYIETLQSNLANLEYIFQ